MLRYELLHLDNIMLNLSYTLAKIQDCVCVYVCVRGRLRQEGKASHCAIINYLQYINSGIERKFSVIQVIVIQVIDTIWFISVPVC